MSFDAAFPQRSGWGSRVPQAGLVVAQAGETRSCLAPGAWLLSLALLLVQGAWATPSGPQQPAASASRVSLHGHRLAVLSEATPLPAQAHDSERTMTLTLVLRRDDQAGFERYLHDVYDPNSSRYHRFLSAQSQAAGYGPSEQTYNELTDYLKGQGLRVVAGSRNRLTLTVAGTRAAVEAAFGTKVRDYSVDPQRFYANAGDPTLPAPLAPKVAAITGLTNLAQAHHAAGAIEAAKAGIVATLKCVACYAAQSAEDMSNSSFDLGQCATQKKAKLPYNAGTFSCLDPPNPGDWRLVDGSGQTVGLVQFDSFETQDVADFLALIDADPARIGNLSQVHVGGGATLGPDQREVLLDIETILTVAPGAKVVVYDAPFTGAGSFQAVFNAMIGDGVSVISNSWAYCEDQTTLADVQSVDAVLQAAAAAGISVFNGSGDTGSSCLDGSPNTLAVPASSPSATAVGGTTLQMGPGQTYGSETWWNGSGDTPPTGQGGFGVSRFFSRPAYQDGMTSSPNRSVPDVVINADPSTGVTLCQAAGGGCPDGLIYGGTSTAAPLWAAFTALLNQALGSNLGALNPLLYPLANGPAFNTPADLGSDFAHVGLGSPNLNKLKLLLAGETPGLPSAEQSEVFQARRNTLGPLPADGTTEGKIVVRLRDELGNSVSGKTIALAADSGAPSIDPAGGVATDSIGAAVFTVTNLVAETLSFTATDVTDGITLDQKPMVEFAVPPAASASIGASPSAVSADGTSSSAITVTLKDALDRPTPGKRVTLSQSAGGHSRISAPVPNVTDASGQAVFAATDLYTEVLDYTAVDVSDGDLPVPGTANVSFFGSDGTSCAVEPPKAADGYAVQPFATGFTAADFFFGGINFGGCQGVIGIAFDTAGNLYASDLVTGNIYKFGSLGGAADAGTLLSSSLGPGVTGLAFGLDGKLYASRAGSPNQDIVEVDPTTGTLVRDNVGTTTLCAFGLATDPLSGDLFSTDYCYTGGSTVITRVSDPGGATPTSSIYVNTSTDTNGQIAFAPDGTLFLRSGANMVRIAGTDQPSPPAVSLVPVDAPNPAGNLGVALGATAGDGSALSLIANVGPHPDFGNDPAGMTAAFDLAGSPAPVSAHLTDGQAEGDLIGPDGCLYMASQDTVYRVTNADGSCSPLDARTQGPQLTLTPSQVSPDPVQGGSQPLTASLHYDGPLADWPVQFIVSGANNVVGLVRTDVDGRAAFSYSGRAAGADKVIAAARVDDRPVESRPAHLTWTPGPHAAFVSLNPSPKGATAGQPIALVASLTDSSADPAIPIPGREVRLSLGADACVGVTGADGLASCSLTPADPGMLALTADFTGSGDYLASTDSSRFNVLSPPAPSSTLDCGSGKASREVLWPATRNLRPIRILGVESSNGEVPAITVTSVFQDEPTGRLAGDPRCKDRAVRFPRGAICLWFQGALCPDAFGIGTPTALLHAEHQRKGDGRVYHVGFTAKDSTGGECNGSVTVCVPKGLFGPRECVDQGALYDSTDPCAEAVP